MTLKLKKVEENRAKRDAMRDMGTRKDKEDDGYGVATDDDRNMNDAIKMLLCK